MQIRTQQYLKRLGDCAAWLDGRQTQLQTAPAYAGLRLQLGEAQNAIQIALTQQAQSGGDASGTAAEKVQLLDTLRHDIETIVRGAHAVSLSQPGFEKKFEMPASSGEQAIAATARIFAANLQDPPTLAALTNLGMQAGTAQELSANSAQYDALFAQQQGSIQSRIASTCYLDDMIHQSSQVVDTLDGLVHFIFAQAPDQLASWKNAKRIPAQTAKRAQPAPPPSA